MKTLRLYTVGVALLCLPTMIGTVHGQGHCAKVSTDVTLYFGVETDLPDPNHPITVDLYHSDFEVSFRASGWEVAICHDAADTGAHGLEIPPADALLYANPNSRWLLPSIPVGFEFIGAKPGEPFWILPQSAGTGALALGLAAEEADSSRLCRWNPADPRGADAPDFWFEVRLLDMRGPADANFALWQADGINPPVVFMSTHEGGITDADVFHVSAGSHVHVNWGFTQPGSYEVDFRIETVLRCDDWLTADWAPPGNDADHGDGRVDFQDFAWMAGYWGRTPLVEDPNTFMFVDPNDPARPVGMAALTALADQWLLCGYPGCYGGDDPNCSD
ncbi:MAG: choice-of-anchor M domain-containing protein [Sedimentisphaerales bacterium]|nr:choice-of-anchor M domain-containing protein [Sedimentisphaerales bacterium]